MSPRTFTTRSGLRVKTGRGADLVTAPCTRNVGRRHQAKVFSEAPVVRIFGLFDDSGLKILYRDSAAGNRCPRRCPKQKMAYTVKTGLGLFAAQLSTVSRKKRDCSAVARKWLYARFGAKLRKLHRNQYCVKLAQLSCDSMGFGGSISIALGGTARLCKP